MMESDKKAGVFNEKERDTLNLIRWLSTIAIVVCHILQAYNNGWAFVLNIGVQIFFFLSGFLYGSKNIKSATSFYKGRFFKLYIPYFIFALAALIIFIIIAPQKLVLSQVLKHFIALDFMPGLNHLWFMKVILMCYLFLPLIDMAITRKKMFIILFLSVGLALCLALRYSPTFLWIALYYVGYICGRYSVIHKYILGVAILITAWIVVFEEFSLDLFREESLASNLLHASAGILIFMTLYFSLRVRSMPKLLRNIISKGGSYEVYLTHALFLGGPASLIFLTNSNWLNILIVAGLIAISSYCLLLTGNLINRRIRFSK